MTRTNRRLMIAITVVCFIGTAAVAQQKRLSPPRKAEGTIGGKKITIDYSAPSMRGRKIMGGLVPFGKVWRTGANEATTLVTEGDMMVGDLSVPKGTYTIYTIPNEKEWTLIINKQTGQWGTEYNADQDLGRVTMNVRRIDKPVEMFVIAIDPGKEKNHGTIRFTWENTEASVPIVMK